MDPQRQCCCKCCCSFCVTSAVTALFLWLSLRTSKPRCYIQEFYLPALNQTHRHPINNTTLTFQFELVNGNKDKGIYYDPLDLSFYYLPPSPNTALLIGSISFPRFYQGYKKKAHRSWSVNTSNLNWTAVNDVVNLNDTAPFRMYLATSVRFKIMFWNTKRQSLVVGAVLPVNSQGVNVDGEGQVNRKGVRLTSGAFQLSCYHALGHVAVIFAFFYFCLF